MKDDPARKTPITGGVVLRGRSMPVPTLVTPLSSTRFPPSFPTLAPISA